MAIEMLPILVSGLIGSVIGSVLTIGSNKYMNDTNEKKQKGEELIPVLNEIKNKVDLLVANNNLTQDDLDEYHDEFLTTRGSVETVLKYYFGKKTSFNVIKFLTRCEGIRKRVVIEETQKSIEEMSIQLEEILKKVLASEKSLGTLEEGAELTMKRVQEYIETQKQTNDLKASISEISERQENSRNLNLENKFMLKEIYGTDSFDVLLNDAKEDLKYAIKSIQEDHLLENRFKKISL